jgi:hypothetical protein
MAVGLSALHADYAYQKVKISLKHVNFALIDEQILHHMLTYITSAGREYCVIALKLV